MHNLANIAAVFGPNGGGKTNLILALATLRDLVLHSSTLTDEQLSERYDPFQFGPSAHQPTDFEIEVLLNQVRYRYSLSYDDQRVTAEKLLVYHTGKSQRWFERRYDEATRRESWMPFSSSFHGPRDLWRQVTRPNGLFFTTAVQLNCGQLKPLFQWFEHEIEIVLSTEAVDLTRTAVRIGNGVFKDRVLHLLRSVDVQIDDVRPAQTESIGLAQPAQPALPESSLGHPVHPDMPSRIEFLYRRTGLPPKWLDSAHEGAGTVRLLGIFGPLLDALEHGKLLVMDEFDIGLHPLVARFLIQIVNNPLYSHRCAQLLLTSQNITLMDQEILRRDEIWLMERRENRASRLRPLLSSVPRKSELIAKHYMRGRYGAVPVIRAQSPAKKWSTPEAAQTTDAPMRSLNLE